MGDGEVEDEMSETEKLIEAIRSHVMTPEDRRKHAISFAFGNVALHNPSVTREMVADQMAKLDDAEKR
jgi:hypothetical protein